MPPPRARPSDRLAEPVAVLHPGSMGAALASQLIAAGATVGWIADGRSAATRARAEQAGLRELGSTAEAAQWAGTVLSVCPPHAALEVAEAVVATGFDGRFADLNAIAPRRMMEVAALFEGTGASVVDGCLIGPPPRGEATPRIYLAGDGGGVAALQALFGGTAVKAVGLGGAVGRASALKMSYALYTKGSLALAGLAAALAQELGVLEALDEEWAGLRSGAPSDGLRRSSSAAWRWSGEMDEIAAACADAGLDPSQPEAAAALYRRWAHRREGEEVPRTELLADLRDPSAARS